MKPYTQMSTETLFKIAKDHKQPKCPPTDGQIKCDMEYYAAIQKKKHPTWMNSENLKINERNK